MKLPENLKGGMYAIEVRPNANQTFTAYLLDLPNLPAGIGPDRESAIKNLVEQTSSMIRELQLKGRMPAPKATSGTESIYLGETRQIGPG